LEAAYDVGQEVNAGKTWERLVIGMEDRFIINNTTKFFNTT
jgi:hypothetical protein